MRAGDGAVSRAREVVMFWKCRAAAAATAKPAPLPPRVSAAVAAADKESEEAALIASSGSPGAAAVSPGGGATGSSDEQGWQQQHHQQKQQQQQQAPLRSSSVPLSPPTPTHSPDWRAPPVSRAVLQSHVIDLASPDPAHQLRALTELLRLTRTHARPSSSASSSSLNPSPATDVLCVIADTGAVPLLVALISSPTSAEAQELAVTVLHNLSLRSRNKERIIRAPGLLDAALALVRGGGGTSDGATPTPTARHNAAALLFSLLAVPRFRDPVGAHPAGVASLAALFLDASAARTGRRDAVKALFHLALCPGNRARVAAAPGLVRGLLDLLLLEPSSSSEPAAAAAAAAAAEQHHRDGLREDAMALLGVVAASPEGRAAVLACPGGVAGLVRELRSGSPRSKEHAANALLVLCRPQDDEEEEGGAGVAGGGGGDALAAVLEHQEGVVESLCQLQSAGTERGRRKANELLKVLVSVDSTTTTTAEGDSHQFQ